ncbi:MAG: 30S ribosomal protein S2 [bacterium]|nr:30S ribosomal protein S2 [bacterium]
MSELDNNSTALAGEDSVPQEQTMDQTLMEEMVKAGVLYGRKKSKTHPRMRPFIFGTRNGIEILELAKTMESIDKAGDFLKETAKKDGLVLVVGTKPASQDLMQEFAKKFSYPYVVKRWLGGTLTNFKTILTRIQYYMNLKVNKATGKLEKYTKKERVEFDKQIEKMEGFFLGLERLSRQPDAVIVVNVNDHMTAVREAKRMNIPVVAILSTDTSPEIVEYPIPANDNSRNSIAWILAKLEAKVQEGLKERPAAVGTVTPAK